MIKLLTSKPILFSCNAMFTLTSNFQTKAVPGMHAFLKLNM